jgi:uncharacterized membrane protein YdjX (TVP38/TMEM64 family)
MSLTRKRVLRLVLLALLVVCGLVVGRATGVTARTSVESVRAFIDAAGPSGVLLFVAAFAIGTLLHVPGLVFVGAAVFVWGRVAGGLIGWLAAVVSVCVTFLVVRGVGGRVLDEIERPIVRRALAQLNDRPVRTVALLRTVLMVSPPLNYALALSAIRFRDYLLGSAAGLALSVAGAVLLLDQLLRW